MVRNERLIINGRFLSAPATGVQRVAAELIRELRQEAGQIRRVFPKGMEIHGPRGASAAPQDPGQLVQRGALRGHPWEQFEFPYRARDALLLNLCNLAPVASRRSVVMIHDAQTFSSPESYSRAFAKSYQTVLPLIGRRAAKVLTVSEYSARELSAYGIAPADKIAVIPNGVDHVLRTRPDTDILRRLGLAGQSYVLAPGSIHAHKNVELLVKLFASEAMSHLTLVLFGGSDVRAPLLGNAPVPPNIVWAGRVTDGELRALTEAALCFAFPSRTEGFGLPPLEAMLLDCPAVVNKGGALPEVCGDAALYASADDPRQWAGVFGELQANPELRRSYATRGARHAASYTWKRAGERLLSELRETNRQSLKAST